MSKFVVDIVVFEGDVIKDTIYNVHALRYDPDHLDLVVNSYGLITYIKHPDKFLLRFDVREIKDE